MGYIGKSPTNGVRNRFVYQATASQTTFSGNDANGIIRCGRNAGHISSVRLGDQAGTGNVCKRRQGVRLTAGSQGD